MSPFSTGADLPLRSAAGGVRLAVRLSPRGRGDHIEGFVRLADGTAALKVSVGAPPAEGRANEALLALLAKEWRVPRRDLAIVGGQKNRIKLVQVAGDPAVLLPRLAALFAALPAT